MLKTWFGRKGSVRPQGDASNINPTNNIEIHVPDDQELHTPQPSSRSGSNNPTRYAGPKSAPPDVTGSGQGSGWSNVSGSQGQGQTQTTTTQQGGGSGGGSRASSMTQSMRRLKLFGTKPPNSAAADTSSTMNNSLEAQTQEKGKMPSGNDTPEQTNTSGVAGVNGLGRNLNGPTGMDKNSKSTPVVELAKKNIILPPQPSQQSQIQNAIPLISSDRDRPFAPSAASTTTAMKVPTLASVSNPGPAVASQAGHTKNRATKGNTLAASMGNMQRNISKGTLQQLAKVDDTAGDIQPSLSSHSSSGLNRHSSSNKGMASSSRDLHSSRGSEKKQVTKAPQVVPPGRSASAAPNVAAVRAVDAGPISSEEMAKQYERQFLKMELLKPTEVLDLSVWLESSFTEQELEAMAGRFDNARAKSSDVFSTVVLDQRIDMIERALNSRTAVVEQIQATYPTHDEILQSYLTPDTQTAQSITASRNTPLPHRNFEDLYEKKELISKGRYTWVWAVHLKNEPKKKFAAKVLEVNESKSMDILAAEARRTLRLQHADIVKCYDAFVEQEIRVVIISELMKGKNLWNVLMYNKKFDECNVRLIIQPILRALVYMKDAKVIHRDISPRNILCTKLFFPVQVKLADFGISTEIVNDAILPREVTGSHLYVAPEVIKAEAYDYAIDMWSLGVVLFLLLRTRHPFFGSTRQQVLDSVSASMPDFSHRKWKSVSDESRNLVMDMLRNDPRFRPTPETALQHAWFRLPDSALKKNRIYADWLSVGARPHGQ